MRTITAEEHFLASGFKGANEQSKTFLARLATSPIDKEKLCHLNAKRLLRWPATPAL